MAKTMAAGEFKAKCLEVLDRVADTGEPVIVTKRGRPVAQVAPVAKKPRTLFGFMKGEMRIVGDIVSPLDEPWEAEHG